MTQPGSQSDPSHVCIKVCGVTSPEDALLVIRAGADALGVNMVAGPRRVSTEEAIEIVSGVVAGAAEVCPVLLAKVTDGRLSEEVECVVAETGIRWLQLYGACDAPTIRKLLQRGLRPVPVVRMANEDSLTSFHAFLRQAGKFRPPAVLLDAHHPEKLGGSGATFPWSWVSEAQRRGELAEWPRIVLAGGLNPDNVAAAVRTVRPWAVDVSSGVEESPGKKDRDKVMAFVRHARSPAEENDYGSPPRTTI